MPTATTIARFLAVALCLSSAWADEATVVMTPQPIPDVLINPGKGWVAYGMPSGQTPRVLALAAAGYDRFEWAQLNPAEDVYDWAPIDRTIAAWKALGKPFGFGVMALSSHTRAPGGYAAPKWVFNDGAGAKGWLVHLDTQPMATAGTPGDKWVPDFADPIYQAKTAKFVRALADRYDGNPDISYIDVRDYGNWGEGHLYPFSRLNKEIVDIAPEQLRALLILYRDAFHRTQLIVPFGSAKYGPIYEWVVVQGMGLRRDGICGNSDGGESSFLLGREPAVFEFFDGYPSLKKLGWWDGPPKNGYGYPLASCVEKGGPSWIGLGGGQAADQLVGEETALVERLANRMGYYFVLARAESPATLASGQPAIVRLDWTNDGVAPVYVPCAVALALLDEARWPVRVAWPLECHPTAWMPGQTVREEAHVDFGTVPPGTYRLAVGLVQAQGESTPLFRLGIAGRTEGGWYPLGEVKVQGPRS